MRNSITSLPVKATKREPYTKRLPKAKEIYLDAEESLEQSHAYFRTKYEKLFSLNPPSIGDIEKYEATAKLFHVATSYGVSEPAASRIARHVEDCLILGSENIRLRKYRELPQAFMTEPNNGHI